MSILNHAGDNWHTKISKLSFEIHLHCLVYVNHFDTWVPHKLSKKKKKILFLFLYAILCWNIMKNILFLKQFCNWYWKVDTVQSCEKEEIMRLAKWTTANHTKGHFSSKQGDIMYMMEL